MHAPSSRPTRHATRRVWRLLVLLLALGSLGFEWQGRVDQLAQELRVAEPGRRRDIVRLLSSYPSPRAHQAIEAALTDPDVEVRLRVAQAAITLRMPKAGDQVMSWLSV